MIFFNNCLALLNTTQWPFRWQKMAQDWLWGGLVHLNIYCAWLYCDLLYCTPVWYMHSVLWTVFIKRFHLHFPFHSWQLNGNKVRPKSNQIYDRAVCFVQQFPADHDMSHSQALPSACSYGCALAGFMYTRHHLTGNAITRFPACKTRLSTLIIIALALSQTSVILY